MESWLLPHLLDVSLRSLPLAVGAAAVLRIRTLRSAAWAHAVWTLVLLSMLLLFVLGPVLKPIPLRVLRASPSEPSQVSEVLPATMWGGLLSCGGLPTRLGVCTRIEKGVGNPPRDAIPPHAAWRSLGAAEAAVFVYIAIAAALLVRLLVGSWLARGLIAGSVPASAGFHESPRIAVPLTIGWFRPAILLPSSWRSWDDSKLKAVLEHERSHIRRKDLLVSLLAGLNRCLFWFHPLAWWLERKLAFLAEQACDEACVCAIQDRREYARLLLEMADAVETAGGRVSGHALAMARPSQVHRRIDAILDETRIAHRGLTGISWAAVLLCGIPVVYAAGSLRIEPKLPLPRSSIPAASLPVQPASPPLARPRPALIAQAPAPPPKPTPAAPAPGPALIPVSVTEPGGRFVTGLTADNFQILSGDVVRPVVSFSSTDGQHAIVALNTTGESKDVVDAFRNTLDPKDEFSVTEGPPAASEAEFMEAIYTAVMEVKQKQNPVKAVVVIMRGARANPLGAEPPLARILRVAARSPRVTIFFANIEDVAGITEGPTFTQQDDIRILTGATGGQLMPVARAEEMATALKRIAAGLRNQYLLGIAPFGPPGALSKLQIEMVGANGLPRLQAVAPAVALLQ